MKDQFDQQYERAKNMEIELYEAVDSKALLASKCSLEITRLTMILNKLREHPKLKSLVAILLEDSQIVQYKNHGLL